MLSSLRQRVKLFIQACDYGLLAALVIPLLALMPLLTYAGLPNTADGPVHLMRQVELNRAWAEGNFYPRWGADLALGYGMPIFSYAPPFLYQLTQLIHLTGLPLDESMKGVVIFDFLLYSVGMFLFARCIFGSSPALLAATVYVYAPYRLREAYIQGNYGQFSGLAFYPLVLWAFHGLITDSRPRYLIAAALSLAGLLFSHNISFMLFAPLFAAYLVFLLGLTPYLHGIYDLRFTIYDLRFTIFRTLTGGVLGLGLAAIFWLPAFGERHDIKLEGITRGFFDFRENFITLPELFSPPHPLDLTAMNPEFPLSLGLPQLISSGAAVLILLFLAVSYLYQRSSTPNGEPSMTGSTPHNTHYVLRLTHILFFVFFLLLYAFLALPYSQGVWENVPLVELAEFPWRMLGPAILCASVLAASALSIVPSFRGYPLMTLGLIIVVIGLNAPYLYPSQFISWGTPTPTEAFAYEAGSGAIGTTSTGEFLPRWAQQHPRPETLWPDYEASRPIQKLDPANLPAGAAVEYVSHQAEAETLKIEAPAPFTATLRTLYWPGWQLYLDDKPVAFTITEPTGLIQATIPAGPHTLKLQLESTPLRTWGMWLSLLAFSILAIITIHSGVIQSITQKRIPHQPLPSSHPAPVRSLPMERPMRCAPGITVPFFTTTTIFLIALYLLSRPLAPLFVLKSNPDYPKPAGHVLQVDFADQVRLVGMDRLPEAIQLPEIGEAELAVVLYWRALQPTDQNYSIFLHLDAPNGQTFATVDEVNPENIPTGNWPPGLYLRNQLHLRIPANLPPIRYDLTTGVYNRQTGQRLAIQPGGATSFRLGSIWLTPVSGTPAQPVVAGFGPDITLHRATLTGNTLVLLWQTGQPLTQEYSIFVHVLAAEGGLVSQADGVPYDGLYPLPNWQPGQLITDARLLDLSRSPATVAIGIYDPATGQRLPAHDPNGQPLPQDSFILSLAK